MIQSYDFIFDAQRDKKLMNEIVDCIESKADKGICTEIHRLIFCGKEQIVMVEPVSDIVQFNYKL